MNLSKRLTIEMIVGALQGLFVAALVIALLGAGLARASFPGEQTGDIPFPMLFGIVNGLVVAAIAGSLRRVFSVAESAALALLGSTALGAIAVLLGRFSENSLTPLSIYAISLVNGALIPTAINIVRAVLTTEEDSRLSG